MKKPAKKRPADTNTRMHSILGEVITISNQPIKAPKKKSTKQSPKRRP